METILERCRETVVKKEATDRAREEVQEEVQEVKKGEMEAEMVQAMAQAMAQELVREMVRAMMDRGLVELVEGEMEAKEVMGVVMGVTMDLEELEVWEVQDQQTTIQTLAVSLKLSNRNDHGKADSLSLKTALSGPWDGPTETTDGESCGVSFSDVGVGMCKSLFIPRFSPIAAPTLTQPR